MKYTVCYPAGHTRVIEFGGMSWTPGELIEFSSPDDIPDVVRADSRFIVAEIAAPARRKKVAKASVVPPTVDNDPTKPEE